MPDEIKSRVQAGERITVEIIYPSGVAGNVLKHGTGALNIAATRVGTKPLVIKGGGGGAGTGWGKKSEINAAREGRFPPNLSHDGSPEALAAFGRFAAPGQQRAVGPEHGAKSSVNTYGDYGPRQLFKPRDETDTSPARFFPALGYGPDDLAFWYSGKASKQDRMNTTHPTTKPISLISWLAKLITPPGGKILDPFAGSGTLAVAAYRLGFDCVLIEKEPEYVAMIKQRIELLRQETPLFREERTEPEQGSLLDA